MHRICHSKIHSLFTEQELRDSYDTLEKLRAHPEVAKLSASCASRTRNTAGATPPAGVSAVARAKSGKVESPCS